MISVRPRFGIGISRDRVSAALVWRGRVRWSAVVERGVSTSLTHALGAVLAQRPRSILPQRAVVAVGPHAVQLKRIVGLPALDSPRSLAAVVNAQPGRFFLETNESLMFSGARVIEPGSVWMAAFDSGVVGTAIDACRAAGLRVDTVVPGVIALRTVLPEQCIEWTDGPMHVSVRCEHGELVRVRRTAEEVATGQVRSSATSNAPSDDHSRSPLDAIGAARTSRREPLAARRVDTRQGRPVSRRRLAIAGLVCVVSVAMAIASPGLASVVVARRLTARASTRPKAALAVAKETGELTTTSELLAAATSFTRGRTSMSLLLIELTRALPQGAAFTALQIDSTGNGSVTAVAPHAAAVVDALERVPLVASPAIVGPVTQEIIGSQSIEHVTVQFRISEAAQP